MTAATHTPTLNPIEVFKPGRHKPGNGAAATFSEAQLRQSAAVYSPALHRAPLVIGHPKTDDLAYGHVATLNYAEGDKRLVAEPAEVEPQFAEMVGDGRLLAVSASFYAPTSPHNPVPGTYYLRHVGFLGAEPPAVKGLKRPTVSFAEGDEEGVLEFSAAERYGWSSLAAIFRNLREWVIGRDGLEAADKVLPNFLVTDVEAAAQEARAEAATEAVAMPAPNYSETEGESVNAEELAAREAALKSEREALDARAAALNAAEASARNLEVAQFAEGLVAQGRLLPKDKALVAALVVAAPAEGTLQFGEGDAAVTKPHAQALREFLAGLPVQVEFGERARADKTVKAAVDLADADAISAAALEFQETESKAGRAVSVEAAVQHVVNINKEHA